MGILSSLGNAVWFTIATIATDIFVLIMYAFAIPRNNINVTKCLAPMHPKRKYNKFHKHETLFNGW